MCTWRLTIGLFHCNMSIERINVYLRSRSRGSDVLMRVSMVLTKIFNGFDDLIRRLGRR